ncbi:DUF6252 family protein [Mucilaginibacter sp.]|uniref:DUF6252 family protein n=1 Tax=Mucilaginibacter sp. TaxID=1882438 RepID=UPI0035BC1FC7
MKRFLFAALVMLSALNFSCTKGGRMCCANPYQPYMSAEKNGIKWDAAVSTSRIAGDSLAIAGSQTEERLVIRIMFNGKGIYNLTGNQATFFTTVGQDVLTSEYGVDNSTKSTIEITEYDNTKAIITGTYYIALKRAANKYPGSPETIRFLKGTFSTYLKN